MGMRPLSSNLTSDVTSEVIWRPLELQRDSRVIEVAGFKSEAIFIALVLASLQGHCPFVRQGIPCAREGRVEIEVA